MVYPFDNPDVGAKQAVTAIWALHEKGPNPLNPNWRAVVVHWNSINLPSEKAKFEGNKSEGDHFEPDFMGDLFDPRDMSKPILNATVEGRMLVTEFYKKPFKRDSPKTGDKMTFMIDPDAKSGGMPDYSKGQKAMLVGFASHQPPDSANKKGDEIIKPIYRDNFKPMGVIKEGGRVHVVYPMYFIPQHGMIREYTGEKNKYQFNMARGITSSLMASRAPAVKARALAARPLPANKIKAGITDDAGQAQVNGDAADSGIEMDNDAAENEIPEDQVDKDLEFLTKPLDEREDFGGDVADADAAGGDDTNW